MFSAVVSVSLPLSTLPMKHIITLCMALVPISTYAMLPTLTSRITKTPYARHQKRYDTTATKALTQHKKWSPIQRKLTRAEMACQVSRMPLDEDIKKRLHAMIRSYETPETALGHIFALPWGTYTQDQYDIKKSRELLDRDHYGMASTKQHVLDLLAVKKLSGGSSSYNPIWCFVGAPGIGKTAICRSIAECMNRTFAKIAMGGARDESIIRGWPASYKSATAGRIVHELIHAKSMNPVILLDEIDKVGKGSEGDNLSSALLELLDPEQRGSFTDHYITIPLDFSQVTFIATANYVDKIAEPLKDRMEMIHISGYSPHEKAIIARKHLIPKILKTSGMTQYPLEISDDSLNYLINNYCPEQGVRRLEQCLRRIIAAHARSLLEHHNPLSCAPATLSRLLGKKSNHQDSTYIW